jgi:hypothetical protein
MRITMKYAMVSAAVLASAVLAFNPASAAMMSCSGDMSQMTTMMAGMPDGPHKWEMNKHLAMINAAMAKDGPRGCSMTMQMMHSKMHSRMHSRMHSSMMGSKMPMMKSGM